MVYNFNSLPKRYRFIPSKAREKIVFTMLGTSAGLIFLVLLALVLVVIINGLKGLSFPVLFMNPSPENEWSMRPAIVGTILLICGALLIAFTLGLGAAIYLTEFAREGKMVSIINYGINNLAGIPSIVFGAFGYAFFTLALHMGKSMYAGWFTLACMLLPTIIRTSQEAIKSVPNEYREGSFALGVTKWRTIRHIVLPAATPGIITGVILSLGRAAGETAAIMFVGGSIIPAFLGFDSRFAALPIQLYLMAISAPSSTREIQWAIALVLLLVVFLFNIGAILMRNRSEKQKGR